MKFLSILSLLPLTSAIPHSTEVNSLILVPETSTDYLSTLVSIPATPSSIPRLVIYVQTFTTPDNEPLSLLPLLEHETKVTHIILAAIHLQSEPGNITLNNDPFESPIYENIWEEVKTLQENGIKVMALLGGAANGTYGMLNGTDEEVSYLS
jgi:hypothetical protein